MASGGRCGDYGLGASLQHPGQVNHPVSCAEHQGPRELSWSWGLRRSRSPGSQACPYSRPPRAVTKAGGGARERRAGLEIHSRPRARVRARPCPPSKGGPAASGSRPRTQGCCLQFQDEPRHLA